MFLESDRKRRTVKITVWVAVLGLLLGVLSSIITAVAADAHAALKSVAPADGAQVATAPSQVVLEFNEPISTSFATVTVTGPSGAASSGRPRVDGTTVTQALTDGLPAGKYTVAFRVVSEDGHPVSDTTRFTVKGASATSSTSTSPEPTMTPGGDTPTSTTSSTSTDESPTTATPSAEGDGRTVRIGLAVGVGALAVAAGTALVAAARRRGSA
ncbi:copper resistance CopC family protein [Phycicoccus sp. Root101]|uniref:copper resistance CopC family protein n=1 Tax=Phycicoccus sp. Root101 TaxID=1736421 RepID=UPI000703940C|nr:copper resistance CopC family protein [Phycicoccus sp. Root101]KQU66530.1 hypothetical protein ASC58_16055 [Phycicoccus sp. Root101]